ncbi:MAG: hypothetical protein IK100_01345 [Muribaculaceae bacterium]|nr:hypothetical protein [Muribaculaceae bacterium]
MTRILRLLLIAAIALPFFGTAEAAEITVCNGENINEYVPVFGFWSDTEEVESQVVYPATYLTSNGLTNGKEIKSITFYVGGSTDGVPNTVPTEMADAVVEIRMGELYTTTISSAAEMMSNRNGMDEVFKGHLTIGENATSMTITLTTPYVYQGNNLLIDFYIVEGSEDCEHSYWTGVQATQTGWNSRYGEQGFLPKMTVNYADIDQSHILNFSANVGGSASNTIPTGTVEVPDNLPSVFTVSEGSVTFTPTEAASYYGTITVDGETYTLIGIGIKEGAPNATRDRNFFKSITYTWKKGGPNATGAEYTSNLSEIATDPDQIIAMLKEVYTNKSIPGNLYRSNKKASADHDNNVNYGAVGTLTSGNTSISAFADTYGWNIRPEGKDANNQTVSYIKQGTYTTGSGWSQQTYTYYYMDPDQFKPDYEGLTLLLLEMVDGFADNIPSISSNPTHNYTQLRQYFEQSIKSARIITEAKRSGEGDEAGTLFKIDCDKLNDFFFIAKGQLLWHKQRYNNNKNTSYTYSFLSYPSWYEDGGGWLDYGLCPNYLDKEPAMFCHMFEEFSPSLSGESGVIDIYDQLISMKDFPVKHDCPNVPYCEGTGHGFRMYNSDYSGDSHDVRDMMFFVPDMRMMNWDYRGSKNTAQSTASSRNQDYYQYYHKSETDSHRPTMAMFVIVQDAITGEELQGKDMYQLTLTWDSNLDEFLPGDQQKYELYQVVTNDNGVETYVPVYYMNADGQYTEADGVTVLQDQSKPVKVLIENPATSAKKTYNKVYVPMQESSQEVTFVVRGCDKNEFLDFKMSNTETFIIPGLNPNEMIRLSDATHYSRFNAQDVTNCYSNMILMKNNAMGINDNKVSVYNSTEGTGTKLTVNRTHTETVGEGENATTTTVNEPVATITFLGNNTLQVTMQNQSAKSDFPKAKSGSGAGYHANGPSHNIEGNSSWTQTYKVKAANSDDPGNIDLDPALVIYDNFVVDVSENAHPNAYTYQLTSNYEGTPASVYLNIGFAASTLNQGNPVYYAYTWNEGQAARWVRGVNMNTDNTLFRFAPVKDNIIFVRMNPAVLEEGNEPNWDLKWDQSGNLSTSGNLGLTYTVWTDDPYHFVGDWRGPVTQETAYSNFFNVRVYKTETGINKTYDRGEVDADVTGYTFEVVNVPTKIDQKVQYSSKKGIYRYDLYRWGETDERLILNSVNGDDEVDLPPTGIADNQDGSYTVSMEGVNQSSVTTDQGETNWATYIDYTPDGSATGKAYTYAPVIELAPAGKNASGDKREDYNTYGGPLENFAVGQFALQQNPPVSGGENALMSDHKWIGEDGNYYSYYNIQLQVNDKSLPAGYNIYKIRAWREITDDILGEEFPVFQADGDLDRITKGNSYLFEDITFPAYDKDETYVLGSKKEKVKVTQINQVTNQPEESEITYSLGTFGARRMITTEQPGDADYDKVLHNSFTVGFFVRIYLTRESNLADLNTQQPQSAPRPRAANPITDSEYADGKYYVVEKSIEVEVKPNDVPTGIIIQNLDTREVVGVTYYNVTGIESSEPFDGVNIMVTRYSDGSTTTTKILK